MYTVDMSVRDTIILHHSAINGDSDQFKQVVAYHKSKWPEMANSSYHFFIERSGEIIAANPLDDITFHAGDWNKRSIGICVAGHLSKQPITPEQIHSLVKTIDLVKHWKTIKLIYNHREIRNTACPSIDLRAVYEKQKEEVHVDPEETLERLLRAIQRGINRGSQRSKDMLNRKRARLLHRYNRF